MDATGLAIDIFDFERPDCLTDRERVTLTSICDGIALEAEHILRSLGWDVRFTSWWQAEGISCEGIVACCGTILGEGTERWLRFPVPSKTSGETIAANLLPHLNRDQWDRIEDRDPEAVSPPTRH